MPPAPTFPGFPLEAPSKLILIQFEGGGFQRTRDLFPCSSTNEISRWGTTQRTVFHLLCFKEIYQYFYLSMFLFLSLLGLWCIIKCFDLYSFPSFVLFYSQQGLQLTVEAELFHKVLSKFSNAIICLKNKCYTHMNKSKEKTRNVNKDVQHERFQREVLSNIQQSTIFYNLRVA